MVAQWATMSAGETIIPTETKKMAPNRSLSGVTTLSILSPSMVSERIEPITKAPRAEEKPTAEAMATIPKQRPMLTMSRISELRYFLAFLSRVGMTNMPTRNQSIRKKASFARLKAISPPAKPLETASEVSSTISRMAIRSSRMMVPKAT